MKLNAIPQSSFTITAKVYAPRKLMTPCPSPQPTWVTDLVANGASMTLESLIVQAGRHFADKLNMAVFTGSDTRRQQATRLAWTLVSMMGPTVSASKLEVVNPGDADVQRLASEILGVGAALELLRLKQVVDARTLRKLSGRFDYEANGPKGMGRVLIEAKGTSNQVSVQQHRASFKSKLTAEGLLKPGALRGYSRAIGIIFSMWESGSNRGKDIEIMDPEETPEQRFQESVREIIKYYARRYDETAGLPKAAARLYEAGTSSTLFHGANSVDSLGRPKELRHTFNRSSFVLASRNEEHTYWGTFWHGDAVPCPLPPEIVKDRSYLYAYTGVDSRVVTFLRERRFEELLNLTMSEDRLYVVTSKDFAGHFLVGHDGVLRAWMNRIPGEIRLEVE